MMMKKNRYLIFTPYQLVTCLNIVSINNRDDNVFLFVNPCVERFERLCKDLGIDVIIIRNLYVKEWSGSILIKYFGLFLNLFELSIKVKNIPIDIYETNELYVPSDDIICRAIFKEVSRFNKSVELSIFDDGVGTYSGYMFRRKRYLGELAYSFFLSSNYCEKISKLYCYRKRLVHNVPNRVLINEIKNNKVILQKFCDLISISNTEYQGIKVLFLDQGLNSPEIKQCLDFLYHKFGDSFVVKRHPRINTGLYDGYRVINDGVPVEAIISSYLNNHCIMISHCSGGCISSCIMGGNSAPDVIFLSDLIECDGWSKMATADLKLMVAELAVSNVFFPKNIKEFKHTINELTML